MEVAELTMGKFMDNFHDAMAHGTVVVAKRARFQGFVLGVKHGAQFGTVEVSESDVPEINDLDSADLLSVFKIVTRERLDQLNESEDD